jgi:hypothetical protein
MNKPLEEVLAVISFRPTQHKDKVFQLTRVRTSCNLCVSNKSEPQTSPFQKSDAFGKQDGQWMVECTMFSNNLFLGQL